MIFIAQNKNIVCNAPSLLIFSVIFCAKECSNIHSFLVKMFGYQKLIFVPALLASTTLLGYVHMLANSNISGYS